jgi:hypothetical protein
LSELSNSPFTDTVIHSNDGPDMPS